MASDLKVTFNGAKLLRALELAPDIFVEEMASATTEGSMLLEREVIERTPTSGAGTLRESIGAMPVQISGVRVSGGVATSMAHAVPVELGSRPHWAPVAPLVDWVERKLGKQGDDAASIAQAVRFKIAHHGTKGAFMFRDGLAASEPQIFAMYDLAATRALARIEGGGA